MSIQKRIWESRIQNLSENKSGSGTGQPPPINTFTQGIGGGAADRSNPVSTGMKADSKKPGGKGPVITSMWNAETGEYEQEKLYSWAVKAVVDSIDSSGKALMDIQTKLGGLTKNQDVTKLVVKKLSADIKNLLHSVKVKETLDILGLDPKNIGKSTGYKKTLLFMVFGGQDPYANTLPPDPAPEPEPPPPYDPEDDPYKPPEGKPPPHYKPTPWHRGVPVPPGRMPNIEWGFPFLEPPDLTPYEGIRYWNPDGGGWSLEPPPIEWPDGFWDDEYLFAID